jgi:folate-binding protein YgfZ
MQPLAAPRPRNHLACMTETALLPDRAVLEVTGADRVAFLQGLVSNDVEQAAPGRAVWAALLTPQGKWLADFFILAEPDCLLLDVERAQAAMIAQKLTRFRLRAKVAIAERPGWHVHAAWGGAPAVPAGAVAAPDPRLPEAGWRILAPEALPATATAADWDAHRLSLGLPDGSRDLESDKSILLEAGFDELGGVSWTKGCYMGQELTARTKYRGLVKRRLVPVALQGAPPPPGTPVLRADGSEAGTLRSAAGGRALATLRLDALAQPLTCGGLPLVPQPAPWMKLPDSAA